MKKWQSFWIFKFKNLKIDISLQWIFILRFCFHQMVPFLMLPISNNCGFAISSIIKKMAAIVNYVKCWCKKKWEKIIWNHVKVSVKIILWSLVMNHHVVVCRNNFALKKAYGRNVWRIKVLQKITEFYSFPWGISQIQ